MTDEQLDNLEALAKAAAPGPWTLVPLDDPPYPGAIETIRAADGTELVRTDSGMYPPHDGDGPYLAAVGPDRVLWLIQDLRRLRASLSPPPSAT